MTTTETTNRKSFRTAADLERTRKAGAVVAKMQEARDAARDALASAEGACAKEPLSSAFARAKTARRELEDAERDLELANAHAAKVEGEVAAAEREAIGAEIARRQRSLGVIIDDEMRLWAVEHALAVARLYTELPARAAAHRASLEEINQLRGRVGESPVEVPSVDALVGPAFREMAEIGMVVQVREGIRSRDVPRAWPIWREGIGSFEPKEYERGDEHFWVEGATGDGTPITTGVDRTAFVHYAASLHDTVKARHAEPGRTAKVFATIAKAAAVSTAILAIGTALAGHG